MSELLNDLVRLTGLEPAHREIPDPKSGASTNSATGANVRAKVRLFVQSTKFEFFKVKSKN